MGWSFHTDNVHVFAFANDVFSPDECKKIIEYAKTKKLEIGSVRGPNNETIVDEDTRKNKVVWIEAETDAAWIYQRIVDAVDQINKKFFNFEIFGFLEKLQFTQYDAPDEHYKAHIDKTCGNVVRKLSITIQLSDPSEYEGGELSMITSHTPDIMKKDQGTLLAFPSYTMHKVSPVTKGTRYSLVGWISGYPFK
jgi:PKHD-type hydroxylase